MPTFTFEAVDPKGNATTGEIEANNEQDAAAKVRQKNLMPTRVSPKRGAAGAVVGKKKGGTSFSIPGFDGVGAKDLTTFTRQFSTLIDAGLPIVRSLDILGTQQKPGMLKRVLEAVKEDVEGGSSLSESMSKHPKAFDRLYVNMVKAGEVGGVLDIIMSRLAEFREKAQRLKRQIIGALLYPAVVVTIAFGILILIIVFIVPKFEEMFREMEIPGGLPPITDLLLSVSRTAADHWYLFLFLPIVIIVLYRLINMNPKGRYALDTVKLHLPIFGTIISKSSVSRFCRTLGTLIASGVPILEALSIIKETTGNEVVSKAVSDVHDSIREGDTIAEPLKHCGVFDDMVVNMIDVGEETGELDKMLNKISDNYDQEIDDLVAGMMSMIEPLLIVFMGGMVGFIVVALFLPLVAIIEGMS